MREQLVVQHLEKRTFRGQDANHWIIGADEVGRGSLAGPIVSASCGVQGQGPWHSKVTDSKRLTAQKRKALYWWIRRHHPVRVCAMSPMAVDRWGIGFCNREVLRAAIVRHPCMMGNESLLGIWIDGNLKLNLSTEVPVESIVQGDLRSYSIGCASIVAKTVRDYLMQRLSRVYPEYGFDSNKGYGTVQHRVAIRRFGVSRVHRKTFCDSVVMTQASLF